MKLIRLLVIGMMFTVLINMGGPALQTNIKQMIGNVNPNAGQAYTLITETGSNWDNISRTISNALNHPAK
jgi:hypothetical protein